MSLWINSKIYIKLFKLLGYEVEHVFPQIFSGSIELLFCKVSKLTCDAEMNKRKQ